uniref:hypothetical protein n=1 Tax=Yoonia sp. TaxID=2212373 RepID=UPI0040485B59
MRFYTRRHLPALAGPKLHPYIRHDQTVGKNLTRLTQQQARVPERVRAAQLA